ncbi:AsnC family transcriptional regulator [Sinomonas halotolerans]|uniref:AsnC family transcriptional regulator n=1 Tax=Sinomonas halotolerans TaxID=1644133 RepID=A0ABU9WXS5_9MICC
METLGEKDLALVNAVQIAPRAPWAQLGEIIDASPPALASRWERLRSRGLVWVTAQHTGRATHQVLSFSELLCRPAQRPEIIERLMETPHVLSIDVFSHRQALALTLAAPSMARLVGDVLDPLLGLEGVTDLESMVSLGMHVTAQNWRLSHLDRRQADALRSIDRRQRSEELRAGLGPEHGPVIALLQRDGRISASEVARVLGLSHATARRRLARVLSSEGFTLRCDMAQGASGFPITVQWFGRLPAADHAAAAQRLAAQSSRLRLVASVTGPRNFLVAMWLPSVNDILAAEKALTAAVPGLEIGESAIMMRPYKRLGWEIRADSSASGRLVPPPSLVEDGGT